MGIEREPGENRLIESDMQGTSLFDRANVRGLVVRMILKDRGTCNLELWNLEPGSGTCFLGEGQVVLRSKLMVGGV